MNEFEWRSVVVVYKIALTGLDLVNFALAEMLKGEGTKC